MSDSSQVNIEHISFFKKRRIPYIAQNEQSDCALACLAMVLNYFGASLGLKDVVNVTGSSNRGNTVKDVVTQALQFGLIARPVQVGMDVLGELRLPAILHWDFNHFVVLEKVSSGSVTILDPAVGRMTIDRADLSKHFTGVAIDFQPNDSFSPTRSERQLRMRDLLNAIRGWRGMAVVLFIVFFILNLMTFLVPQLFQFAIDAAVQQSSTNLVVVIFGGLMLLAIVRVAIATFAGAALINFRMAASLGIFQIILQRLLFLPNNYFRSRSVGDTLSRMQSFDQIQEIMTSDAVEAIINGIFGLLSLILIYLYNPFLLLITLGFFALQMLTVASFYGPVRRKTNDTVVTQARSESKLVETVRGFQSIKTLGIEDNQLQDVSKTEVDNVNAVIGLEKLRLLQSVPHELLTDFQRYVTAGFAIYLVSKGDLTIGMFYAVTTYAQSFTSSSNAVLQFAFSVAEARVHVDRIADIVTEDTELPLSHINQFVASDGMGEGLSEPVYQGEIAKLETLSLEAVAFRYAPTSPFIFTDIDLMVQADETLCILGPSGQGKSTLLKLLIGLEQPSSGRLLVNGEPYDANTIRPLRRRISVVMQEDMLFSGSIAKNIAQGSDAVDYEEVEQALALANVLDEVLDMPMGVYTLLGDMGSIISTGQRQRIILARALYRNPDVIIMDEGTAHLDGKSKLSVMENLANMSAGLVYATHDEELSEFADRVFVLDENGWRQQR